MPLCTSSINYFYIDNVFFLLFNSKTTDLLGGRKFYLFLKICFPSFFFRRCCWVYEWEETLKFTLTVARVNFKIIFFINFCSQNLFYRERKENWNVPRPTKEKESSTTTLTFFVFLFFCHLSCTQFISSEIY